MRFSTMTLGCKVNQYETGAIESILTGRGHELVKPGDGCDVCIINTCAVTLESVRKSRQAINRMKKLEPNARIAICGCYSELENEEVTNLGADLISGTKDRTAFALKVEELIMQSCNPQQNRTQEPSPCLYTFEDLPPSTTTTRTRALLKIQDGCDNYCAYYMIPYAREHSRSLPHDRIEEHAKQLENQGYKEIIITGIEISSYGKDLPPTLSTTSLINAISTIQTAAPAARLRLGSLDPAILKDDFIQNLKTIPNICNHFHLSLQSGCDETLKRMGRKYNTSQTQKAISSLRSHFKDCAITADLITGFPGETEAEFEQTLDTITKAKFSDMHIFPFSPRPKTKAAEMPGQVEKHTRKERAHKATEVAAAMANDFKESQIGKTVEVLFEQQKHGCSVGHSSNYLEIHAQEKKAKNTMHKVRITGFKNNRLTGEIV